MSNEDLNLVLAVATAVGTLAVPVVVAILAARFNSRTKKFEASQRLNQELIKVRLEYYRELVPQLNDLMCYFTFIGRWKEFAPPAIIELKRKVDREFHCAAPLFNQPVVEAYNAFMRGCFQTFGEWGTDARLVTSFGHRRAAMGTGWNDEWNAKFVHDGGPVAAQELIAVRESYNALIGCFAKDIELNVSRRRYVTTDVPADAR